MSKRQFGVGNWVEVRSKEEILQTLDQDGRLDGMPFMPEMLDFCGKRFQVYKSAHKTCDTVFPLRSRRIEDTVHLQTRCSGQGHGGCQAACLLFWKEAWLKPAGEGPSQPRAMGAGNQSGDRAAVTTKPLCTEQDLFDATRLKGDDPDVAYVCQATRLPYATKHLSPYDPRQYIEDYVSGNVGLAQLLRGMVYISYVKVLNLGVGVGKPMRWFYEVFQRLRGGRPYPRHHGLIALGESTPVDQLNLREGEVVRVKSYQEILATVDLNNKNRGMYFDAEMVPYCGGIYRVLSRVDKILDERTGKMMRMKNACIILDKVVCRAWYSQCRMYCPRAIYPYWREIWLERVGPADELSRSAQPTSPGS